MRDHPPQPSRRQYLRLALGAGAALASGAAMHGAALAASALVWRERRLQGLGTDLSLTAAHADAARADAALDAAVAAIRHVERQFSLFDPDSALSRLNRDGELHKPHPDFLHLLTLAKQVSSQSRGAFDVTVQPLWQAWQHAKTQGRLPSQGELNQARARVGWQALGISPEHIRFEKPGMAVTLNGIAQGFAGDLASAALRAHGVAHALLDTGEWSLLGQSPEAGPWRLGVANPRRGTERDGSNKVLAPLVATLALAAQSGQPGNHRALATSSDAHYRFGEGDRHHHIVDPKTGHSPTALASVTVLAANCTMADALTKVLFMGDLAGALQTARQWQADVLAIDKSGRWAASPGMRERIV
jgi:FAD:protein FMN transferase